ncbi:ABC transporter permease [Pontibacter sp. G13]|uniref:ABC transporter permease n=1 Tax=Pontibacter sp. G13 TaxID=3074898 RepID=UPI00288AB589|nr:ABC transporter permease [Pontibacter sp. G13]WNJ16324.1 ABC transporter permease [Pontibacter sp. G13]
MQIIWTIFKREYLNLVMKKTFLISMFAVPLGMIAIMAISAASAMWVEEEHYKVYVPTGDFGPITESLKSSDFFEFVPTDLSEEALKDSVKAQGNAILVTLSRTIISGKKQGHANLYSSKNLSTQVEVGLKNKLRSAVRNYKEQEAGITEAQLEAMSFDLDVQSHKLTDEGEKATSAILAMIIGGGVSVVMYMLIAIYGSVLMQGIVEEKSNRIVEVIVSSVKPFKLLMGKVLGIGAVGLTQFFGWAILAMLGMVGVQLLFGLPDASVTPQPGMDSAMVENEVENVIQMIYTFDWSVLWFLPIYFIGGFLIFGSLLAAAGSAVDNIQDATQFTLPITMFMVVPMMLMNNLLQNPNGTLAKTMSMVPFFSPVAMPMRMSMVALPWYEILLSILLLIGGFLGCIWVAGRIYRTGILMYGKKPSFKEIIRWVGRA